MISFLHPEAFLLALPIFFLMRRRFFTKNPLVGVVRTVVLFLVLGVLADPYTPGSRAGRDLVFVVDRSRSVPEGSADTVEEVAQLAAERMQPGDRIGMVVFGARAAVEASPREGYRFAPPARDLNRDGSDLAAAIDMALTVIPPGRRGSVLVLSDGEYTGADPSPQARAALRRGIRIDAKWLYREGASDAALEEVALPGEVGAGEPFQFCAWVRCEKPTVADWRVLRDGEEITRGRREFRPGLNSIVCRDRLLAPGVHRYEVELDIPEDRVHENNRAAAVVRVVGAARILCVTPGGRTDRLVRSLEAAGLRVVVAAPETSLLDLNALDGFRAVVLENVAAGDLPPQALRNLGHYVEDLGGGLLLTGGRASFGSGGYHQSAVEEVLPVSMEIREEQRKFSLAMAIALDRSGSMAVGVGGGGTKMDLANLGASAAVDLLGPSDSVSVVAVDSAAHVVVPTTPVADEAGIISRIRSIKSMGGGIFTFTAVKASAAQLVRAPQGTKHMVIFADAADAEEPGNYKSFVPDLVKAGITVSVIGLGSDTDRDAAFLKDLAAVGKGRCFFCSDPRDLPRVFALETIQVARSSFVTEETAVEVLPNILALGDIAQRGFPAVRGYSIAYLKPRADAGLATEDDQEAPLLSFWQCGLGRAAAFLGEADGTYSGRLATWPEYGRFFDTLVRWLAGNRANDQVFARVERQGHQGVITVEVEEGLEAILDQLEPRVIGPGGKREKLFLSRVDDTRAEARFALGANGVYRAAVKVTGEEDGFLRLPPLTLPYSPEYAPQVDPRQGEKTLRRLVRIGEGRLDPRADEILAGSRESSGITPLARHFAWCALFLFLVEIAVRRLHLSIPFAAVRRIRLPRPRLRRKRPARKDRPEKTPAPEPDAAPAEEPEKPPPSPPPGLGSILDRAKDRARKRRG